MLAIGNPCVGEPLEHKSVGDAPVVAPAMEDVALLSGFAACYIRPERTVDELSREPRCAQSLKVSHGTLYVERPHPP